MVLLQGLINAVTFDPIDVQDQVNDIFALEFDEEKDYELEESFIELGYESPYLVINMGSLCLFIAIESALLLCSIILWLLPLCPKRIKKAARKRIKGVFFNGLLAFIDGAFLVLLFQAALNLQKYR